MIYSDLYGWQREGLDNTPERRYGMKIKKARVGRGLSQADLGSLVGVTQRMISKYESGESLPDVLMAEKLQEVLQF
jgi:transcriptional regulator with XRE-family HTH domain